MGVGQQQSKEFEEKVLFINRCAKVVKGGRRFSFSALILVGDREGRVGYGFAKANELSEAIRKGGEAARKSIITFVKDGDTIPHELQIKQDGVKLLIKPAPKGSGIRAGGRVRSVLEAAGIHDCSVKSLGCSNPLNQVRAIFRALQQLRSREDILTARGMA